MEGNNLVRGARGKFRKEFVFKKKGEDTHLTGMPLRDKNRKPKDSEMVVREKFISARYYAEAAMADPVLKAFYTSKVSPNNTAFNVAFRDFQTQPSIRVIEAFDYTGAVGSEIAVAAYAEGSKVTDVTVRIFSATGVLIEEGQAVFVGMRGAKYYYSATQNNPALPGCKITAIVKSLPGNTGTKDLIL